MLTLPSCWSYLRECVGLQSALGRVRMITDCSKISGAARGEEHANCKLYHWIRKGKEVGCLKVQES